MHHLHVHTAVCGYRVHVRAVVLLGRACLPLGLGRDGEGLDKLPPCVGNTAGSPGGREGGREREGEGGREGERERGREGGREGQRGEGEGGREGRREGGREGRE